MIIIVKITGIRAVLRVEGHSVDEVSVLPSASVVIIVVISVFLEISLENPRQE
jgi:hypothetical protein